ncbi:MAG: NYN domain-containing protein [Holophagaceae bacterium]|nr:NYN domain-containing protein [Holophagaceae bacterium]
MMRCAVFIDGNNLFHSARNLGFEVDYSKLLEMLTGKDRLLIRASFYTGVDESADKQRNFLRWMRRNGFMVVQKPVKADRDGLRRANLEVEISTDMMAFAEKVDTIILVSGNEDFAYPLSVLAQRGTRIEVAGFRSAMASKILDCADRYIDLDSLSEKFRKENPYEDHDPYDFSERL